MKRKLHLMGTVWYLELWIQVEYNHVNTVVLLVNSIYNYNLILLQRQQFFDKKLWVASVLHFLPEGIFYSLSKYYTVAPTSNLAHPHFLILKVCIVKYINIANFLLMELFGNKEYLVYISYSNQHLSTQLR